MSILNRATRERLYRDEELFNQLIPFAKYDGENGLFVHSDASLWSMWELRPLPLTSTSDSSAFDTCKSVQELLDALEHTISVQVNWITTFDVEDILHDSLVKYPTSGPSGWMAKRWIRMVRSTSKSENLSQRPRRMRLLISFRFDPPWRARGIWEEVKRAFRLLVKGDAGVSAEERRSEYLSYAGTFKSTVDGIVAKLGDLGLAPMRVDGQSIINVMYPLLNRRSVKGGKFKRGRSTGIVAPEYDPHDFLANQFSDTRAEHPKDGFIKKDGKVYRSVSMVKTPKQLLPLMLTPLQALPYENIISVTYSKDEKEKVMGRLDKLDATLGRRESSPLGRLNQKVAHQIQAVRSLRQDLYNNDAQLVRCGLHQVFVTQNEEEAVRASSEALATFPQLNGARGMSHEIADLGVMINSLPGCYDPTLDGAGWTVNCRSSRGVRLFPLWGNWRGSSGPLFVLPNLWNRELTSFDLFDSNIAPNVLISGVSGAGKSYLLCYLLITLNRGHFSVMPDGKQVERQPITFIFDKGMPNQPCGFDKLAQFFGGRIYEATPSKAPSMNFLARFGEIASDGGNQDFKDLLDVCADVVIDMATDPTSHVTRLERTTVIETLMEAHRLYRSGPRKREMILSDVAMVLRAPRRVDEDEASALRRHRIVNLINDYYGDGTYARFFDRPGALKLKERFIVFDLKGLSRNPDLQRVFLKIAMLWADNVMNEPSEMDTRKILVFDEAHDLIGKTQGNVIESAFRLYRKRKGMVIAASQSGEDFFAGSGGQAIVQNSAHKIFLRQDPNKFHMTAQIFNLNRQQVEVIMRLRTIKGIESQFFLLSDIGEAALILPVEPAYYWVSTNNGDDNQLFYSVLQEAGGNFWNALERVATLAPNGAAAFKSSNGAMSMAMQQSNTKIFTPGDKFTDKQN
jgi:hypothetical protein